MKKNDLISVQDVLELEPEDNRRLANLCGQCDEHLKIIQDHFGVKVAHRGHKFTIKGGQSTVQAVAKVIKLLYQKTADFPNLNPHEVHMSMQGICDTVLEHDTSKVIAIPTKKAGLVTAKGQNQMVYMQRILSNDVNFGIGPAGTGKTFLAVTCAVDALEKEQVNRIVLVRPAVEAGESLGFLPGDFSQKVEPYLRPLYDALHDLMGPEWVQRHAERGHIEVAPLAYMRGRTLNDSFIILDEAQNTTIEQMKMFLTRLGFGSTVVITGDVTQIDLPGGKQSGLMHAAKVLKDIEGISFTHFDAKDAVRHRLVKKIIRAYGAYEQSRKPE